MPTRAARPTKQDKAREVERLDKVRSFALRVLAGMGITHPDAIDLEEIGGAIGAEVVLEDLEGATARVIQIGDRARIVVSTRSLDVGAIRFSIAHEIGHVLCQHHVRPGDSELVLDRICSPLTIAGDDIEREAAVFAAELLMPAPMVRPWCAVAPTSLDPVRAIASTFQTSLLASAMRYVELTPERCAVVVTQRGRVTWAKKSSTFTAYLPKGRAVQPESAAFDYFDHGTLERSSRVVPAATWLPRAAKDVDAPMHEHATVLPGSGGVFSLLWIPRDATS